MHAPRRIDHGDTASLCIRCGQSFLRPADSCPYCVGLRITVFEMSELDPSERRWAFELWRMAPDLRSDDELVGTVVGFENATQAHVRAHEFMRWCVVEMLKR